MTGKIILWLHIYFKNRTLLLEVYDLIKHFISLSAALTNLNDSYDGGAKYNTDCQLD